jgi:uncharacterized protein (DUF924 family)
METPASILAFWFGSAATDAAVAQAQSSLWWQKNPATDAAIRARFAAWTEQAASGALDGWRATPQGLLALIVLTDQFPRNMYRGTPQSFAFDALALGWCKEGLASGAHLQLRPIERVFFYLPLEHSEVLADQQQAVAMMGALAAAVPADQREPFNGFANYAERHQAVVARFGRFPHRNAILGRASTPEEMAFLREPGSSF